MYGVKNFEDSNVPTNGYQFPCPVVGRDAVLIACWYMRSKYMTGKRVPAADCHCAMRGSKCPAMRMLDLEWRSGERMFYDAEPTKHRSLPKIILEAIEKVILVAGHAAGLTLTDDQSKRLFNGKIVVPPDALEIIVKSESAKTVKRARTETTDVNSLDFIPDATEMLNGAISSKGE